MTSMLSLSNGVSAQVVSQSDAPTVLPETLRVHFWRDGRVVASMDWAAVVEDLTSELPVLANDAWLELSAYDRYLVDGAGWDILMAHGIVPTHWRS